MKKNVLGVMALAMVFCFSDSADARYGRGNSSYNKSKVNRAVSYLNTAKRMRTRSAQIRYFNMAQSQLNQLRLTTATDRNNLRFARNYINNAKRYSRNRSSLIRYTNMAISRLRRIKGYAGRSYNRRPVRTTRASFRALNDAKRYLNYAGRSRNRATITRNLSMARSKIYRYRGRAGGNINTAMTYINKSRQYLRQGNTARAATYARMARSRVDRAINYMRR